MAHGSCLCGEVKYSFTGEPVGQALCHCRSCRKLTGSTNTTALLIPRNAFTFVSGTNNLKSFVAKHETGINFTIKFCSTCGSTIFKDAAETNDFGDVFIVMGGTLDKEAGEDTMGVDDVKVGTELWTKYRPNWLEAIPGAGQCQEFA